jgi:hypothetical protein
MFRCRQQLLPKRRRLSTRCNSRAAVHVALVNAFARNTVAVLEQYVMPEHLGEALDKLHARSLCEVGQRCKLTVRPEVRGSACYPRSRASRCAASSPGPPARDVGVSRFSMTPSLA